MQKMVRVRFQKTLVLREHAAVYFLLVKILFAYRHVFRLHIMYHFSSPQNQHT